MGIEDESSIETGLEQFVEGLTDAGEFAKAHGISTPLQELPSFDTLIGHEEEMIAALSKHFGVDLSKPEVVDTYSMFGALGSSGEGEIKVRVIKTNDPDIFVAEYEYADGDKVWAIRPLEFEE